MNESTLKKEFSQRDVQRMRNLITKKYGDSTRIQTGYEKRNEVRQEGEEWEENGKIWTIKDGLKQSISKLEGLKRLVVLPLLCPKCSKLVRVNDLNKKMFAIHNMCFNCVIEFENKLKAKGLYEAYEKQILNSNKLALVSDLEKALDDWLITDDNIITEAGDIENWQKTTAKEKLHSEAKETLQKIKDKEL